MEIKNKILSNSFFQGSGQIVLFLVHYVLVPYQIAKMGLVGFGLLGMAKIFFVEGYLGFFEFGLQTTATKYVSEFHTKQQIDKLSKLINTSFWFLLGIGIIISVSMFLVGSSFLDQLKMDANDLEKFKTALPWIFISYLFMFPNFLFVGTLEGLHRFDLTNAIDVFFAFLYGLLNIFLLESGFSYLEVLKGNIILLLLQALVSAYYAYKYAGIKLNLKFDFEILKEIKASLRFISISRLSGILFLQTDRILLSYYLGPIAITGYEVITKLPRFLKMIGGIGTSVVMPVASRLKALNQNSHLQKLFSEGLSFNLYFSYPIILGAVYFTPHILEVWVGPEFTYLTLPQRLMFIWNMSFPFGIGWNILFGINQALASSMVISWSGTIIKLITTIVLIEKYQLLAIVLGYVFPQILIFVSLYIFSKKLKLDLKLLLKSIGSIILVSIPLFSLAYLMDLIITNNNLITLLIKYVLFCGIYWILLYRFVFSTYQKQISLEILSKILKRLKIKVS